MKKRILTLAAAALMVGSMGTMAFAADTPVDQDTVDKTVGATVNYEVPTTYTVKIPSTVTVDKDTPTTFTFSAENVMLPKDTTVDVTVSGLTDGAVTLTAGEGATATTTLKLGDNAYVNSTAVASFTRDTTADNGTGKNSVTEALTLSAPAAKFAGTYTGTVTFEIKATSNP